MFISIAISIVRDKGTISIVRDKGKRTAITAMQRAWFLPKNQPMGIAALPVPMLTDQRSRYNFCRLMLKE